MAMAKVSDAKIGLNNFLLLLFYTHFKKQVNAKQQCNVFPPLKLHSCQFFHRPPPYMHCDVCFYYFEGWRLRTAECASYVWIELSVLHLAQSSLITVYCLDCIITTLFENLINWYHNVLKIEPLFRLDGTSKFVKRLQNDIGPQVIKLPPQI